MTNWTIEAARERDARDESLASSETILDNLLQELKSDRAHLLAEVERLQQLVDDMNREALTIGAMLAESRHGDKIKRLQAELSGLKGEVSAADSIEQVRLHEIERLQDALDRVRGLPEKWRGGSGSGDYADGVCDCADELDAALEDE